MVRPLALDLLLRARTEELHRVHRVPVRVLGGKVLAEDVPRHRRDLEDAGPPLEVTLELVDGEPPRRARAVRVVREHRRDGPPDGRLLSDHEHHGEVAVAHGGYDTGVQPRSWGKMDVAWGEGVAPQWYGGVRDRAFYKPIS